MTDTRLLRILCAYLVGVPIITSINGLSMHLAGVSAIGPAYHTLFSLLIIAAALVSPHVEKNRLAIIAVAGLFAMLVVVQVALGLSDFSLADVGQLYKWFLPLLLFAVLCRWQYLSTPEARAKLSFVFEIIPIIYSVLILISLLSYLLFNFNPTVFDFGSSTQRFIGFAWAYNPTVDAFFICGYLTLVLRNIAVWKKLLCGVGFALLISKTAVVYFGFLGFSFVRERFKKISGTSRALVLVPTVVVLAAVFWFGLTQSFRSANLYGNYSSAPLTIQDFAEVAQAGRLDWWIYMLGDVSDWPLTNIIFGNGLNVDRRLESPLWQETVGHFYEGKDLDKSNKVLELDMLGHFDLFGLAGAIPFAFVFYVYPLFAIKLPYFKLYSLFITFLSVFGGDLLNNPQTGTLLVVLFLFLRRYQHKAPFNAFKVQSWRPDTPSRLHELKGASAH